MTIEVLDGMSNRRRPSDGGTQPCSCESTPLITPPSSPVRSDLEEGGFDNDADNACDKGNTGAQVDVL